ncbi:hypothetical protein Tco_1469968 [Tanacetum coccineum]
MASMKYCDKHNQVGFLKKPEESAGFAEIVDFLKGSHIRYALTHNPTIHDSLVKQFWQTATASTLADGTLELRATIDTLEYTITEASVQSKLQLADASRISMLPNTEIFEGMGNMGYPTDGQANQAGTQSQPSSSTVPPPPTSQPAPTESTTIPPTPLMTGIEILEKDLKQTMGNAIVKLVKKVKKLEKVVKSRQVVLTDSEDEAARNSSKQGRNLQKDESEVFETPKQGKSSGETKIIRRKLDAEDVSTGFKDVSIGFTDIKSASEKVSSSGEHVSQREGKAVLEETPQTKRTKKQIREEHASLAEIARIQAEDEAKNARREELKRQDALATKRLQEELELSEAQKKRMAQVQEAAQFYTEEDWDTIRAKMEANADLVKEIAGEDVSEANYAQRMVGLISQRRKLIGEQKAKAQRDKPMTQA